MTIQIKAHFNKQTKDSKKELLQFYVKGSDENKPGLNQLCREIVELTIEGVEQSLTAEFSNLNKDSKKSVLGFIVKGDTSAAQSFEFYKMAGSDVELSITESQMSIEDFRADNDDRGITYNVDADGLAQVDQNQLTIDDVEHDGTLNMDEQVANDEQPDNVADLGKERAKRVTKKEKEAQAAAAAALLGDDEDEEQQDEDDDELPI